VLEIYIQNLDKNLWELDQMAASAATAANEMECAQEFHRFAEQGLTKVNTDNPPARLLKKYFRQQLRTVRHSIAVQKKVLRTALATKSQAARELADNYQQLLWKREKYRMETYGFVWSQMGWINIDRGTEPKTWGPQPLEIVVDNGSEFDRVYTYVVYTSITSLYRLNTDDNKHFYVGNAQDQKILMPKRASATAITIAYKGMIPAIAEQVFETGTDQQLTLHAKISTLEAVTARIDQYSDYASENLIAQDLVFMEQFYVEKKRQQALQRDNEIMFRLFGTAFPCADQQGHLLFVRHCASCHHQDMQQKLTSPALGGVQNRWRDDKALYAFIRNSQQLIGKGDPRAVRLWNSWKPTLMNSFEQLSDEDIAAILRYVAHRN
jgi:cytochrome c553